MPMQECGEGVVRGDGEPGGVYRRVNRELKQVSTYHFLQPRQDKEKGEGRNVGLCICIQCYIKTY